jgi:hypothetical protein
MPRTTAAPARAAATATSASVLAITREGSTRPLLARTPPVRQAAALNVEIQADVIHDDPHPHILAAPVSAEA